MPIFMFVLQAIYKVLPLWRNLKVIRNNLITSRFSSLRYSKSLLFSMHGFGEGGGLKRLNFKFISNVKKI